MKNLTKSEEAILRFTKAYEKITVWDCVTIESKNKNGARAVNVKNVVEKLIKKGLLKSVSENIFKIM